MVNAPVMFNRRLREQEIELWLKLVRNSTDTGYIEQNLAYSFLQLPETIAYISSINDEIIGGTSIYRDRIRLGMVLCSVAIQEKYREISTYQMIKTSLPFMRTVAIRDVDAVIRRPADEKGIGFPASFELDAWMSNVLKKIGFVSVGNIWSYTLESIDVLNLKSDGIHWDIEPDLEGTKQLIWEQSKTAGIDTSLIWTALDFAVNRGTLRTFSVNGSTRIAVSIDKLSNIMIGGFLVIDPEYTTDSIVNHLANELGRRQQLRIHLPLVGEGQKDFIEFLGEKMGASLNKRSLTLLRKSL
jgi:hypothetical protein